MSAPVRPIRLPGASAIDAVRQRAQRALDGWARDWVCGAGDAVRPALRLEVGVVEPWALDDAPAFVDAYLHEGAMVWFSDGDHTALAAALLADDRHEADDDPWIEHAVDCALTACRRALAAALFDADPGALQRTAAPLPASLAAYGAGTLRLTCIALGLSAVADAGVWRTLPPPAPEALAALPAPLALERALRRTTARLAVPLGEVEVELSALADLRAGDVLRLPRRTDERVAVLCEGQPLAHAVLGSAHGRLAVQMYTTSDA